MGGCGWAGVKPELGLPGRCMRPRSRQRAVVVAWDRQLMVAGNSTECIQYPLGKRGHFQRPAQTVGLRGPPLGPLLSLSWCSRNTSGVSGPPRTEEAKLVPLLCSFVSISSAQP